VPAIVVYLLNQVDWVIASIMAEEGLINVNGTQYYLAVSEYISETRSI